MSNFLNKLFFKIHTYIHFIFCNFLHFPLRSLLITKYPFISCKLVKTYEAKATTFFIQFSPIFLFLFLHILWWLKYIILYFRFFKKLFLLYFYYVIPYISLTHIHDISESHAWISCFLKACSTKFFAARLTRTLPLLLHPALHYFFVFSLPLRCFFAAPGKINRKKRPNSKSYRYTVAKTDLPQRKELRSEIYFFSEICFLPLAVILSLSFFHKLFFSAHYSRLLNSPFSIVQCKRRWWEWEK